MRLQQEVWEYEYRVDTYLKLLRSKRRVCVGSRSPEITVAVLETDSWWTSCRTSLWGKSQLKNHRHLCLSRLKVRNPVCESVWLTWGNRLKMRKSMSRFELVTLTTKFTTCTTSKSSVGTDDKTSGVVAEVDCRCLFLGPAFTEKVHVLLLWWLS